MGFPKKIKKDINLYLEKTLYPRRVELLDKINEHGTYLPKSILHADLDRGFLDFVRDDLKVVVDGKIIPVIDILVTLQNWSQFTEKWKFQDLDKNATPPFISVVRVPEIKYGTHPSLIYTIPNRRHYYYASVPSFDGNKMNVDVYKIPQPVPVDITYNVKIVCSRMRELNMLNKNILQKFSSRQAYTQIKGHYIPIIWNNVTDDASVTEIEKRKYYIQSYNFTMMGFLIDENEFEIKPAISRTLALIETEQKTKRSKKPKNDLISLSNEKVIIDFPVGVTDYTQTYEYSSDLYMLGSNNISSYQIFVNGLLYGTNLFNSPNSKIQLNTNDVLLIQVVKTNPSENSTFDLISKIV
jgi:hypothetical protein